jgi:hypothetical protein
MAQDSEIEPSDPDLAFEMEVIELPPELAEPEPPEERAEAVTGSDELPTMVEPAPAALDGSADVVAKLDDKLLGELLAHEVGVLGALSSADAGAGDLANVLGDAPDGLALGALIGTEARIGSGGLGLAGSGEAIGGLGTRGQGLAGLSATGGGGMALGRGLGSLGPKGGDAPKLRARAAIVGTTGPITSSTLDRAVRGRLTRLARCVQDETPPGTQDEVELSLTFRGSRLTSLQVLPPDPEQPEEADHPGSERCALRMLRGLTLPSADLDDEDVGERQATLRLSFTHPELDAAPQPDASSSSEASPELPPVE